LLRLGHNLTLLAARGAEIPKKVNVIVHHEGTIVPGEAMEEHKRVGGGGEEMREGTLLERRRSGAHYTHPDRLLGEEFGI
jgi:hypothetical protein